MSDVDSNVQGQHESQMDSIMAKVDEHLNLEEVTLVYRGVKQPQNASQLAIELAALKQVRQNIDARISSLEFDFTLYIERVKLAQAFARKDATTAHPEAPTAQPAHAVPQSEASDPPPQPEISVAPQP